MLEERGTRNKKCCSGKLWGTFFPHLSTNFNFPQYFKEYPLPLSLGMVNNLLYRKDWEIYLSSNFSLSCNTIQIAICIETNWLGSLLPHSQYSGDNRYFWLWHERVTSANGTQDKKYPPWPSSYHLCLPSTEPKADDFKDKNFVSRDYC